MRLRFAAEKKTLYVSRPLESTDTFRAWAKEQGFENLDDHGLHVTIAYSEKEVDWGTIPEAPKKLTVSGGPRSVEPLGDEGAVVLKFESPDLASRHQEIRDTSGATWSHNQYQPHVTISYEADDVDLDDVEPYRGELVFGPEKLAEVED